MLIPNLHKTPWEGWLNIFPEETSCIISPDLLNMVHMWHCHNMNHTVVLQDFKLVFFLCACISRRSVMSTGEGSCVWNSNIQIQGELFQESVSGVHLIALDVKEDHPQRVKNMTAQTWLLHLRPSELWHSTLSEAPCEPLSQSAYSQNRKENQTKSTPLSSSYKSLQTM
jgi:hypothetical protein